jgi:hypothetical protein
MSYQEAKGCRLLSVYHTMANIMLDVCISPCNESIFDSHTTQFVMLVGQLAELWLHAESLPPTRLISEHTPGQCIDMAQSHLDVGWIPLLFYVAIKCRVHRVRLQAIRLLETCSHREGFWDTEIASCIARKVMEIEERGFYQNNNIAESFPLSGCPTARDLSLPLIPKSYRVRGLDVVLSGSPMDKILLFGKQERRGESLMVLISEYNIPRQRWKDKLEG